MSIKVSAGKKGVAADHSLAVKAGLRILEEGGNAFDAAITVSAVLSVVQPQMGGPGGDGFVLGFLGDEFISYASSGRSFSGLNVDRYLEEKPLRGPLTVTVPGLVYLWGLLYEEYATKSLEELLRPAISLAYNGFHAGWFLSRSSETYERELEGFAWSKYFKGIKLGDLVINRDMARTLRLIASRGWDEFYYGSLAEEIVSQLQSQGVDIGLEDLMEHEGFRVEPLKLELSDKTLYELPPNSQGVSTLQLIDALHKLELDKYDFRDPSRITMWSEPVETVYKFRDLFLGDPDHIKLNINDYITYSSIRKLVSERNTGVNRDLSISDTTFFIVSDGESLIGFIQSLFYPFGSGLVVGGFPVQNRGYGFAKERGLPNSPAPRKRPLHTLSILAVERDREKYIIGCVGGDYRPQLHLRVYENLFIYNMNLVETLSAPRFIYTKPTRRQRVIVEEPLRINRESSIDADIVYVGLHESPGHVHIAYREDRRGVTFLSSDPRTEGVNILIS